MPKCIVIADDLTGANATGVLLKKMNYSAYTVLNAERLELSMLEQCDCVLYPTDSRGIDQDLAYRRVSNVCNLLKNEDTANELTVLYEETWGRKWTPCWNPLEKTMWLLW